MTKQEDNAISQSLLALATATEMMMDFWLRSQHATLTGESKMLFNGMQHGIQQARHYYERFTDKYTSVLYEMDKDCDRIDSIRKEASFVARIYLTCLNLYFNNITNEEIEKRLQSMIDDSDELFISKEVIDKLKIR